MTVATLGGRKMYREFALLDQMVGRTHIGIVMDAKYRQRELADAEAKEIQRTCRCGECGSRLLMPWEPSVGHHVVKCPNGHTGPWVKEDTLTKVVSGVRINMSTGQEIAQTQETRIVKWETTYHGQVETTLAEVKARFCPKATDNEVAVFMAYCAAYLLNPYAKEVYLIKYQDGEPASIVIGKDAYIKHARANSTFRKMEAGCIVTDSDGVMHRRLGLVYPGDKLIGGWSKVTMMGADTGEIEEHEIEVDIKNYDTDRFIWKTKKSDMIRKVALVQNLRECFPTGMDRPEDPGLPVAIEGDIVEGALFEVDNGEDFGAVYYAPDSEVSAPPKPQESPTESPTESPETQTRPTPPTQPTPKPKPPGPAQVRQAHANANKLCEEHNRSWGPHPTTGEVGHPMGDGTKDADGNPTWHYQQQDNMVDQLEKDFEAQG